MHTLFIVCGQPAVGKTTWAGQLAKTQHACFIDIDTVSEPLVHAGLRLAGHDPDDRDSTLYKTAFRQPVYQAMFAMANDNLPHTNVVLCAPFTQELANQHWPQQLASQYGCNVMVYWLFAKAETIKQRMIIRGNNRDRNKLKRWDDYQAYFKAMPQCRHIAVDCDI